MGKHLHFDCFNGISGDMTLGALVDLGLDVAELKKGLAGLPIGEFDLRAERVKRAGIMATRVTVEVAEEPHKHAHLRHIVEKVKAAGLPERAERRAIEAYGFIAEAEARVHGSTPEKIHFHEVGAKDAIVDVAGAMLGVELLGIESFSASVVAVGHGRVQCSHGVMPIPAPATAEILKGLPSEPTEIEGELTTPTGAAILRTLVGASAGATPPMRAAAIGYGAGTREVPGHPNCLRLALGETEAAGPELPVEHEEIAILETEIDDMTAQVAGYLMERLLAAGALDAHFQPVQMKKNRPGQQIRALCRVEDSDRLAEIFFAETSTFGLRRRRAERLCLRRRMETLETPLGPVEVKVGLWGERALKASPEFESCRALAAARGVPLRVAMDAARRAIEERYFPRG